MPVLNSDECKAKFMSIAPGIIAQFLQKAGLLQEMRESKNDNSSDIFRLATDSLAKDGDLAWLSPKQLELHPNRLREYAGSALICPPLESRHNDWMPEQACLLTCNNPKLAFIRVAHEFFPEVFKSTLPSIHESSIAPTAKVGDQVTLGRGVVLGAHAHIGSNVFIGPNTVLDNCTISDHVVIGANCSIGMTGFGYERDTDGKYWRFPHLGKVILEEGVEIGSNTCIDRGALGLTRIGRGVKIDNLVHIAHNVDVGENSLIIANAMVAGSCKIGSNSWIAPSTSLKNQIEIGSGAIVGLGAVVLKNVEAGATVVGNPAKLFVKTNQAN